MLNVMATQGVHSYKHQGILTDLAASNYVKNKLSCTDQRIGNYNTLKLTDSNKGFERVIVFYNEKKFPFIEKDKKIKLLKEKIKFSYDSPEEKERERMITELENEIDITNIKKGIIDGED